MSAMLNIALCGWFRQYIAEALDSDRKRTIPSLGWNGHCHSCSLPRLIGGETSSRCSLCLRFRVSAPLLTSSSFCSCACDCYEIDDGAEEAAADDLLDSSYTEEPEEAFSVSVDRDNGIRSTVSSRRTSTDSISSTYSERYAVDEDEFFQLAHGLSFWEIHDLELVSGLSQDQLMEDFPEIESVHGRRRQEEEPPSPTPTFCHDCRRPLFREVVEALDRGIVQSCDNCCRPLLAADPDMNGLLAYSDFERCRCRCVCDEDDDEKKESCYLPFLCNNRRLAPVPWVRAELEARGFCVPDTCNDGGFCAMVEEANMPTLSQIRDGTYREDCRRQMDEAGQAYQHYLDSSTFLNGVHRDRDTDSGLPLVLENYLRSLDPGAFGHEPSTRPHAPTPDAGSRWEEAEVPNGLADLESPSSHYDADRNPRLINLHCWINQNEWRLEEDDAESTCTADDLGISREHYASELTVAENSGRELNAAAGHSWRHLYRRYDRIIELGGHMACPEDLEYVVSAELEYYDFLEFIETDHSSVLMMEHPTARHNPFPQPGELRADDVLEEALNFETARAPMQDVLNGPHTARTSDNAAFHTMQQHVQRPRMIVVGGPVQRANASPDIYGEYPAPFRRVIIGPGLTVLVDEDELDLDDAIFVDSVDQLGEPGPAVDARDVEFMEID